MLKIKYHIVIGMCGIFALLDNRAESKPLSDKDIYYANMIQPRGPDHSEFYQMGKAHFVFHRLAINGLDDSSSMPFVLNNCLLIANAEIYNHKELEELYNIKPTSESDCEILIHLYNKFGRGQGAIHRICSEIDAEFAFIIYDDNSKTMFAARDSYGVRPLFYSNDDKYYFASEMKAIPSDVNIKAVLPGSIIEIYKDNMTISYYHFVRITKWLDISISQIHQTIRKYFYGAVKRRLMSQRQIGCLLSGGLDSSLVAAVIAREVPDLHCFSIGIGEESVDLIAARRVAEFIGIKPSNHHIIHFTVEDGFHALKYVIFALESWDVTTIRAGIVNYLLAKYIAKNTDIKVLLSGSGADEVFCGYQYSKMINSSADLARDSRRLLSELYMFDNLRDDRVTAAFGLEVRVPFLSKDLVEYIGTISPELRMCNAGQIEKKLLRDSFKNEELLPYDILYRRKEAFSNGVSGAVDWYEEMIRRFIEPMISDNELLNSKYEHCPPRTKEALYYRQIFEEYYPSCANVITHLWLPPVELCGEFTDPSARILPVYV